MSNSITTTPEKPSLDKAGRRRIVVVLLTMAIGWAILFLGAGTLRYPAAWAYVVLQLVVYLTAGLYIIRHNPGIINERDNIQVEKSWDRVIMWLYAPQMALMPLVAGLDYRFGWSTVPLWLQIISFIMIVPGMVLPYWAMLVNNYLVVTVRVQEERDHSVVTGGPYHYVRHPMYVGIILSFLFTPLALGSWWAMIPGGIAIAAIIARTSMEDKTLREELPGYVAYSEETRYRLLPGVW
jgi:protein-S-isoprenylcysteine O-methyltransferase Ste14